MLHPSYPGLEDKEEIYPKPELPYFTIQSKVDNTYLDKSDKLFIMTRFKDVFIIEANFRKENLNFFFC